jgi:hypothetical protein
VTNIWRRNRGNHLYHRKCGGWGILNKGHLITPIFNDRMTLVCEIIKRVTKRVGAPHPFVD